MDDFEGGILDWGLYFNLSWRDWDISWLYSWIYLLSLGGVDILGPGVNLMDDDM
jgi:hypothetical protein